MTSLRERVGGERRRLKSVREALSTALSGQTKRDAAYVPFYIAVAEYMETSMGRLHAQDVKMGDMIREKLGTLDDNAEQALSELDERLSGNQDHLRRFAAGRQALQKEGAAALDRFEEAARGYTQFIVTNMGHHGLTTDLAARLFTQDDWEYMAGITDEETRTEQKQYERVFASLPPAMKDYQRSA